MTIANPGESGTAIQILPDAALAMALRVASSRRGKLYLLHRWNQALSARVRAGQPIEVQCRDTRQALIFRDVCRGLRYRWSVKGALAGVNAPLIGNEGCERPGWLLAGENRPSTRA